MEDNNMDISNIASSLCDGFIYKSGKKTGKLSKDELLTYNSALRMLKAIMDKVANEFYNDPAEHIKNDNDETQGAIA